MNAKEKAVIDIVEKALAKLNRRLTGIVFQIIQDDSKLNVEFMRAVGELKWKRVNQIIGAYIRDKYGLVSTKKRNRHPDSALVRSHSELKFKWDDVYVAVYVADGALRKFYGVSRRLSKHLHKSTVVGISPVFDP